MRSEAQQYIFINDDDPDLTPIQIWLPKPPKYSLIAGYDLPTEKQMWKVPKIPDRLRKLEKDGNHPRTIEEIWQVLESNPMKYAEEITFIKTQWYHRLYGYWFFNNGVPTYITGKHYYFLCYYYLDTGLPDYRDRDRKYWLTIQFLETDTYDFVNKDSKGNAIYSIEEETGRKYFAMYDTGERVFMGDLYPKFRREGATFRAQCNNLETITKAKSADGGIQSRNEEDARKVFLKNLAPAFKKLPFFFKPLYSNTTDPKKVLTFNSAATSVTAKSGSISSIDVGLESQITYGSGKEDDYDGYKLLFFHDDEIGKCVNYDVMKRNNITKTCLTERGMIIGWTSKTSTVGDMDDGGGKNFEEMCEQSNFYQRDENGKTASGLCVHFRSATEGYFLDKYGHSLKAKSKDYIESERKILLDTGNLVGWNEKVRQFPLVYRECFTSSATGMGFNIYNIELRMNVLRFPPKTTKTGNFIRVDDRDINSKVLFIATEQGRWEVSKELPEQLTNRKLFKNNVWFPSEVKFIAGADTFRMAVTEGKRQSNGGGAVFELRDNMNDTGDIKDWKSNRFVCTYRYRPGTTEEYCDDMLKMCQYYGAMMYPETNISNVTDNFTKWGYAGFLLHSIEKNGAVRVTPGMHSGENSKQELLLELAAHIELHCHRENHIDLLDDCKKITSVKRMKDYDLLTAAGLCLMGAKTGYWGHIEKKQNQSYQLADYVSFTNMN